MTCPSLGVTTTVSFASNDTITKAQTPRGYPCDNPLEAANCGTFMSTPLVVEMGRKHFNCPSLAGVELENNDPVCGQPGMKLRVFR